LPNGTFAVLPSLRLERSAARHGRVALGPSHLAASGAARVLLRRVRATDRRR